MKFFFRQMFVDTLKKKFLSNLRKDNKISSKNCESQSFWFGMR